MTIRPATTTAGAAGFTLIETLVSMGILAAGLLSLAAVFSLGLTRMGTSTSDLVMVQKATEAIESVFAGRDSLVLSWSQIRNVVGAGGDGGIFLDGPQLLRTPGPDGLINTSDDGAVEETTLPGRDNLIGTADDEVVSLDGYTREIEIRDVSPGLRQIRVIVRSGVGDAVSEYVLVSYISTYA